MTSAVNNNRTARPPKSGGCPAFTLIELMVSVAVIAVGLVSVLRSVSLTIFGLNRVQNQYFAARICREKIEEVEEEILRSGQINEESQQEEVEFENKNFLVSAEVTSQTVDLTIFPQYFSGDTEPVEYATISDELYQITVTAEWSERGTAQEMVIETYFTR